MIGCFTLFLLNNNSTQSTKFQLQMLIDTVLSYSLVRQILDESRLPFSKYLDDYGDGEEVPEEIASHVFMRFQMMRNNSQR